MLVAVPIVGCDVTMVGWDVPKEGKDGTLPDVVLPKEKLGVDCEISILLLGG